MQNIITSVNERIHEYDFLRGFAMFGILLLHNLEHFDFYFFPDIGIDIIKTIDKGIWDTIFFVFAGKSYALFALLFGTSFHIQMCNYKRRGEIFLLKFLWRLMILFAMGYIHGLIFCGDVLQVIAILGLTTLFFYKFSNTFLTIVCVLFLIDLPNLYQLYASTQQVGFVLPASLMDYYYGLSYDVYRFGSFLDVAVFNSWKGQLAKWFFFYETGRYTQMCGLFLLGILIGRLDVISILKTKKLMLFIAMIMALVFFMVFYAIMEYSKVADIEKVQHILTERIIGSYANVCFMIFWVTALVYLYRFELLKVIYDGLALYGKMGLTNYVSMGLCLIPLYYGYGLGLYQYCGATACCLIALLFFSLQLTFCRYWLKSHRYGPVEWFWRACTKLNFKLEGG